LELRDIISLGFLDDSRDLTSLNRVTAPPSETGKPIMIDKPNPEVHQEPGDRRIKA